MKIPESLSAIVYLLREPWPWTLAVWSVGFADVALMMGRGADVLAFAVGVCIGFVGALPLIKGEENVAHNVIGLLACVLSQAWVLSAGMPWWVLTSVWVAYTLLLKCMWQWWCLAAELLCVSMVLVSCLI